MTNENQNKSECAEMYNGRCVTYSLVLQKQGFGDFDVTWLRCAEHFANGESEDYHIVDLTAKHKSGVPLTLRMKFIPSNDEDNSDNRDFDHLVEVHVNGVKYEHYYECLHGPANYQLTYDFHDFIKGKRKGSIKDWVANGGKFAA